MYCKIALIMQEWLYLTELCIYTVDLRSSFNIRLTSFVLVRPWKYRKGYAPMSFVVLVHLDFYLTRSCFGFGYQVSQLRRKFAA